MLTKKTIKTEFKNQKVNITNSIEEIVLENSVQNGVCIVFIPYIDANLLMTTLDDPLVQEDISDDLTRIFPSRDNFKYSGLLTKGSAHSKGSIIGMSINLTIDNKKLILSDLQGVFLSENVGSQSRDYYIKVFGK